MRTAAEIIVDAAYRIHPDDIEKQKAYITARLQRVIEHKFTSIGESNLESILFQVCEICGANPHTIKTKYRGQEAREARAIMYVILKRMMRWTLKSIGGEFGHRDHATIINGIRNHDDWSASDKYFRNKSNMAIEFAHKTLFENDEQTN